MLIDICSVPIPVEGRRPIDVTLVYNDDLSKVLINEYSQNVHYLRGTPEELPPLR